MSRTDKRLDDLEKAINPDDKVKITVNWDENPELPGDDVIVIEWDDVEGNYGEC